MHTTLTCFVWTSKELLIISEYWVTLYLSNFYCAVRNKSLNIIQVNFDLERWLVASTSPRSPWFYYGEFHVSFVVQEGLFTAKNFGIFHVSVNSPMLKNYLHFNALFVNKKSQLCFNYTWIRVKENIQTHSPKTKLSVCKTATCFGYIYIYIYIYIEPSSGWT